MEPMIYETKTALVLRRDLAALRIGRSHLVLAVEVVEQVELHERSPTKAIDQQKTLAPRFGREIAENRAQHVLGDGVGRSKLAAPTSRFAVDADSHLHFIDGKLERRLACSWHRAPPVPDATRGR